MRHFPTKPSLKKLLLPVPIVTAIKNEGIRLGILEQCSGGVGLTHNGKEYVEQALGFKGIDLCLYRRTGGKRTGKGRIR